MWDSMGAVPGKDDPVYAGMRDAGVTVAGWPERGFMAGPG